MKNKRLIIIGIISITLFISLFMLFKKNDSTYELYNTDSPTRIGEVHLVVSDVDNLTAFYQQVIGFDILTKESKRVTLTADGRTPLLILEEQEDSVERPFPSTGLYHFAIIMPDHVSLGNMMLHFAQTKYPMQGAANHQYSDALYLADPDGNGIEIYADLSPDTWERDKNGGYAGGSYPMDFEKLAAEANPNWNGLPDDTRIGHMHLQATELVMTEKFYVDGLDFNVTSKDDGSLFLSKDNYHHHIALNTWSGTGIPAPPDNSRGLKNFTLLFSKEELEEAKTRLTDLDFLFEEKDNSIIVQDPSRNTIEIISK
ncbi:VOC family protein [Psychrobacillus lasiicapitis]|uniref:VOC family protein n=1 Tax=Psychrobacillus lasiicapitis TaxID=1636719 RepID=A0A544TC57_9BACI|nr:VOC family protein [Psychrobacillus lasiicapitis]TQR15042.1 VOC family protein [Psychrobacillus lasiicapitis]GGA21986.1 glyoxalase [Psychrobacillus lasiicapitis]